MGITKTQHNSFIQMRQDGLVVTASDLSLRNPPRPLATISFRRVVAVRVTVVFQYPSLSVSRPARPFRDASQSYLVKRLPGTVCSYLSFRLSQWVSILVPMVQPGVSHSSQPFRQYPLYTAPTQLVQLFVVGG